MIMINDINNGIDSNVSLFVEDTRIIRPVMNHSDEEALQGDLDNSSTIGKKLATWLSTQINLRCSGIAGTRKKTLSNCTYYFSPQSKLLLDCCLPVNL